MPSTSSSSSSSPERDAADSVGLLTKEFAVAAADDDDSETGTPRRRTVPRPWQDARPRTNRYLVAAVVLLGATNLLTLLTALRPLRSTCPLPVNHPPTGVARVVEHLVTKPQPQLLNVTFYDHEHDIFRQHSSNATDAAWYEYTQVDSGLLLVSREDAAQAALDPARHVYFDNPELGLEGFPVKLEAIHQMHCLNLLRMNLYYNIEHTRATCGPPHCDGPEEYVQLHIDHCVEVLRLRLQCTADIGVTPLLWLGREGRVTGDMARMHTCSDYEKVRSFVKDKTIPVPKQGTVKPKPEDFVVHDYI